MAEIKITSLFSGCGGMDLGLIGGFSYLNKMYSKLPGKIVYAIDNDPYACKIYNENFSHRCLCSDIRLENKFKKIPAHDILVGGFPCQSFSIIAQNPPRLGFKDERGQLFFEMCKILKQRKPKAFIAENVKGLLSANKKKAFPLILQAFRKEGYFVTFKVLNAADFGVPQKRERVLIVGFREKDMLNKFKFPEPITQKNKVALKKVIFSEKLIENKYYFSDRAIAGMQRVQHKMNKGRIQNINQPCNTLSAHLAKVSINSTDPVLKINNRYRRFTPTEAARIQSFPDNFKFIGADGRKYRAIGNAVPPVLMWHVAKEVYEALS